MLRSRAFSGFLSSGGRHKQHLVIEISMSVSRQRGIGAASISSWNEIRMSRVSDSDEIRSRPVPMWRLSECKDK
jgi:hypothetical protein